MDASPVIGLGCQRSGTSVTGHVLAAPERSGFQMENGIIRMSMIWFNNAFDDGAALAASRFTEFLRALTCRSERHGSRMRPEAAKAIARYQGDGRMAHWIKTDDGAAFVRQLCFDVLTRGNDVVYWGDKYPEHLFLSEHLRKVFPEAKWLFIWREPAAVLEALSRKLVVSPNRPVANWRFSVEDCARQWVTWNRKWLDLRNELPAENRTEVSFDRLVQDPPTELARVSEFVGFDLLADRASKKRAATLRAGELDKWRASDRASEIEAQLARDDVQAVYEELKRAPPEGGGPGAG